MPVLAAQWHHLLLAWLIGAVLNIVFAFLHTGMLSGPFAGRSQHQAVAFISGLTLLAAGITTGLLFVPVLLHAALNRAARDPGVQALKSSDADLAGRTLTLSLRKNHRLTVKL